MAVPNLNLAQLGFEIGGSAGIGALIGFFAKKVAKLLAIIVGGELVLFRFLESRGILTVDWEALSGGLIQIGEQGQEGVSWLVSFVSTAGVGAGFAGGFFLGFRRA